MKSDAVLWRLGAVFLASEKAIAIVRYLAKNGWFYKTIYK